MLFEQATQPPRNGRLPSRALPHRFDGSAPGRIRRYLSPLAREPPLGGDAVYAESVPVGPQHGLDMWLRALRDQLARAFLEEAVGVRRPLLVLAQVLLPGRHEVHLHEALRVGAVLEEAPTLATRPPPRSSDRQHRLAEGLGTLGRHAVLDGHEHGAVARIRVYHEVRLGPGLPGAHLES